MLSTSGAYSHAVSCATILYTISIYDYDLDEAVMLSVSFYADSYHRVDD